MGIVSGNVLVAWSIAVRILDETSATLGLSLVGSDCFVGIVGFSETENPRRTPSSTVCDFTVVSAPFVASFTGVGFDKLVVDCADSEPSHSALDPCDGATTS
jgi:hypothetical protein